MAGYNLGGYASQLNMEDYNQALQNAGSQYRVPEQSDSAVGGVIGGLLGGGSDEPAQPPPQAQLDSSGAPAQPEAPSVGNVQPVKKTAGQKAGLVGGLLGGNSGGNRFGAVLNLVGSLYGGGAAKAAQGYSAVKK